ncbi:pyrroline-5-carboxylate reductase [Nocardia camponoti]|uniref:Pyrroline-5-carboxylate reductase n=1 Tax=Nocardia camponoti TaxID=1616106 RepID=A0A917QHD7_9NOCA|nr:pyrroline-5-carboxylate reductase [Nocardia camponoti]GGK50658.1 pyrroline-5-carboxylate reductase [Nocardia camponoti]
MTRIAVVGGGRIGEALVAGLLEAGKPAKDLVVVEPSKARAAQLAERFGVRVSSSIGDGVVGADIVVIAVKPGVVDSVLVELSKADGESTKDQLVVSLAAGVTTAQLEAKLPAGFPVVRVMPNTPMLVGQGMSVLSAGRYADADQVKQVGDLLETVGKVVTVPEAQMDAVTAVSGSGPAYFFLVVEAMVDGGVGLGLTREVATELVVQTMIGSAALLDETKQSAGELRAAVTSPGGTTAAALRELEKCAVRSAFIEALHAAKHRSAEHGTSKE